MAVLKVFYYLSPTGRKAALLAGRNAGVVQTILLQSPGHTPPSPPSEVVDQLKGWSLPPPSTETQGLVEALQALIATAAALTAVLHPDATPDVVVEEASPELWEAAVNLARFSEDGKGMGVGCGYDSTDNRKIVGYRVEQGSRSGSFSSKPVIESGSMDRLMTAAEMIPMEAARRKHLKELEDEADAEVSRRNQEHSAHRETRNAETLWTLANEFVGNHQAYLHLPEVKALADMVAEGAARFRGPDNDAHERTARSTVDAYRRSEELRDRRSWISEHGSPLLKRLSESDMACSEEYWQERLAFDLPGWVRGGSSYITDVGRQPTLAEFELLDRAKAMAPSAVLGCTGYSKTARYVPVCLYRNCWVYLDR